MSEEAQYYHKRLSAQEVLSLQKAAQKADMLKELKENRVFKELVERCYLQELDDQTSADLMDRVRVDDREGMERAGFVMRAIDNFRRWLLIIEQNGVAATKILEENE